MKKLQLSYSFLAIAFALSIYACKKSNGITNQPYIYYGTDTTQGLLKVNLAFAYTVDYASLIIKVNNKIVATSLQTRTPFPGGGYNTRGSNYALYMPVPKGSDTVSIVLPKAGTTTDSIVFYTTIFNIPAVGPYTLHITDTLVNGGINKTQSVLVKNEVARVDTGFCRFRFVNLIPNQPSVDLYLNGILVKSGLAYLQPSDTFRVTTGVNAPGYSLTNTTPTWAIRPAGAAATSTALASYANVSSLQSANVMSIFCMGYAGSTGTRLPYLSFTLDNQTY